MSDGVSDMNTELAVRVKENLANAEKEIKKEGLTDQAYSDLTIRITVYKELLEFA